jgi:hypothetical protein
MPRSRKPTPVHVKTECSLCGLDWDKHPDEPTVYDCVELLKVEAAKPPITKYVPYYPYPYQWTGERPLTCTIEVPKQPARLPEIICKTEPTEAGALSKTISWNLKPHL